jgi:hypothetical protein
MRMESGDTTTLFRDILVTVTGAESGWLALSQAAEIARRESGTLHGLHVVPVDTEEARENDERVLDEFAFRCQSLEVPCTRRLVVGDVAAEIIERARGSTGGHQPASRAGRMGRAAPGHHLSNRDDPDAAADPGRAGHQRHVDAPPGDRLRRQ